MCVEGAKSFLREAAAPVIRFACKFGKELADQAGNEEKRYYTIAYELREWETCEFDLRWLAYVTRFWPEPVFSALLAQAHKRFDKSRALQFGDFSPLCADGWESILQGWRAAKDQSSRVGQLRQLFEIPAMPLLSQEELRPAQIHAGVVELLGVTETCDLDFMLEKAGELVQVTGSPVLVLDARKLKDEKVGTDEVGFILDEAQKLPGALVMIHRIDELAGERDKYVRLRSEINRRKESSQCFVLTTADRGPCIGAFTREHVGERFEFVGYVRKQILAPFVADGSRYGDLIETLRTGNR